MLCDTVVRAAETWNNPFGIKKARGADAAFLRKWLAESAALVRNSERFVLDQDAIRVITHVQESKPATLLAGTGIVRVPHQRVWVEFGSDEFLSALNEIGTRNTWSKYGQGGHVGLLIKATDQTFQRGIYQVVFQETARSCPVRYPIAVAFDFSNPDENTVHRFRAEKNILMEGSSIRSFSETNPGIAHRHHENKEHEQALVDLNNLFLVLHHQKACGVLNAVAQGRDIDQAYLHRKWVRLVGFYTRTVMSCLMLLNSRNLAQTTFMSAPAINRSLCKGQTQVRLSHGKVSINLSKVQRNRDIAGSSDSADTPLHSVRGHWKVRKTGVFYWRPFDRGNPAQGTITRNYHVTA